MIKKLTTYFTRLIMGSKEFESRSASPEENLKDLALDDLTMRGVRAVIILFGVALTAIGVLLAALIWAMFQTVVWSQFP